MVCQYNRCQCAPIFCSAKESHAGLELHEGKWRKNLGKINPLTIICDFFFFTFVCVGMPACISAVQWRSRTMNWLLWRSSIALWSCWISTLAVWVIPRHHPSFFCPLFFSHFLSLFHTSHYSITKPVKSSVLSNSFDFFSSVPTSAFYPLLFLLYCHVSFLVTFWINVTAHFNISNGLITLCWLRILVILWIIHLSL